MEDPAAATPRSLELVAPRRLWFWAWVIVLVGVALRVIWFSRYEEWLPLGLGSVFSGHFWALGQDMFPPHGGAVDSLVITKAFAPGYGLLLRGAFELGGDMHSVRLVLLVGQSLIVAAATLLTFALSRRVLFGWAALVPCLLLTASIALIELPGGLAPQLPLMLLLVLLVWLLTLLHERGLRRGRGGGDVLLTLLAGLTLGGAVLFNPAVLLLVLPLIWWAFRGIGREHATLLLVAAILLPASWLAVADSVIPGSLPVEQARAFSEPAAGNVVDSVGQAVDRVYAVITPWNPRFARGTWASANWNYEWLLPLSLRAETTYQAVTRVLAAVLMVGYLLLVLGGVLALFAEGAGSAERLLALPVLTLPLATFFSSAGNLLRVAILPLLMVCLCVGAAWLLSSMDSAPRNRPDG